MKRHVAWLKKHGACSAAVAWAENCDTMQSAWDHCPRPDWMLWLITAADGCSHATMRNALRRFWHKWDRCAYSVENETIDESRMRRANYLREIVPQFIIPE